MNKSSLADPSLVERVYQYLYDNRGDLARPVALVVASADKIESCDTVQQALKGALPNSYVIANYVTIDASTGVIDRWQILALSPTHRCDQADDNTKCSDAFPLCSSLDVCARLFEGSREGLKGALAHVLAQVATSEKPGLSAALVETSRDPLQQVQYRCAQVYASTRSFAADLARENVVAKNENGPADPAKPNSTTTNTTTGANNTNNTSKCKQCDVAVDQLIASARKAKRAVQRKQQHYAILGLALLFLVLTLVAVLIATRKSYAKRAHKRTEKKVNALYDDMVNRRAYDKALASLSTDSSVAY